MAEASFCLSGGESCLDNLGAIVIAAPLLTKHAFEGLLQGH